MHNQLREITIESYFVHYFLYRGLNLLNFTHCYLIAVVYTAKYEYVYLVGLWICVLWWLLEFDLFLGTFYAHWVWKSNTQISKADQTTYTLLLISQLKDKNCITKSFWLCKHQLAKTQHLGIPLMKIILYLS